MEFLTDIISLFFGVMFIGLGIAVVSTQDGKLVTSIRYDEFEYKNKQAYINRVGVIETAFGSMFALSAILDMSVLEPKEGLVVFLCLAGGMVVVMMANQLASLKYKYDDKVEKEEEEIKTNG